MQTLRGYKPVGKETVCAALDRKSKKEIVVNVLKTYNKRLDNEQMDRLLAKQGNTYRHYSYLQFAESLEQVVACLLKGRKSASAPMCLQRLTLSTGPVTRWLGVLEGV